MEAVGLRTHFKERVQGRLGCEGAFEQRCWRGGDSPWGYFQDERGTNAKGTSQEKVPFQEGRAGPGSGVTRETLEELHSETPGAAEGSAGGARRTR